MQTSARTSATVAHLDDGTPAAPGDLEVVRAFVSLHDHTAGSDDGLPPSAATIEAWLRSSTLLGDEPVSDEDLRWAIDVHGALRTRVVANPATTHAVEADRVLDDAVARTGLTPRFGAAGAALEPTRTGIRRAIGRVLAVAFLAGLDDDTWSRFRGCADPTCRAVFWDRSKNRSGRWCSMSSCGNRAKVRAYRERHAAR